MGKRIVLRACPLLLAGALLLAGCQGRPDYYKEGMKYYKVGEYTQALEMFDKALASNRAHYDAWLARGDTLFYMQRYPEAVESFRQATWAQVGSHREAREALDKAIEMNPDDAGLWVMKGDFLRQKSGQAEALAAYEKALQINPRSYGAWSGKYYSLRNDGRLEEAEQWRNAGIEAGVL